MEERGTGQSWPPTRPVGKSGLKDGAYDRRDDAEIIECGIPAKIQGHSISERHWHVISERNGDAWTYDSNTVFDILILSIRFRSTL